MNENINTPRENELIGLYQLNVEVDGVIVLYPTNFSMQKHRVYLLTGGDENHNAILLKAMAGLLPFRYVRGQVLFKGKDIYDGTEPELDGIRQKMAFIFAEGTLISNLTVEENLLLPLGYHFPGYDRQAVMERIKTYFNFFKIRDVLGERPAALSYATKKKLAFIRTALLEPELILMDKPLFNLDNPAQELVFTFLEELKKNGSTIVMVSQCPHGWTGLIDETLLLDEGCLKVRLNGKEECMEGWD